MQIIVGKLCKKHRVGRSVDLLNRGDGFALGHHHRVSPVVASDRFPFFSGSDVYRRAPPFPLKPRLTENPRDFSIPWTTGHGPDAGNNHRQLEITIRNTANSIEKKD